jgi:cell division control protein 7
MVTRRVPGTFSTVYKAEDLLYDRYDNSWDLDRDADKWTPPPLKSFTSQSSATLDYQAQSQTRRKPKYVAIKKIYVTSSPSRILNEVELLHDLRGCQSVCPLITAFRWTDQVVAILPYFRHADFREYFRNMTVPDIAIYLRSLFTALASVHGRNILHRDIKPTNFLYDPATRRGVLVDFGLAEREGSDCKPCVCHDDPLARKNKLRPLVSSKTKEGYPREDTRPSRRANRAGTRGFRAPEVLFKCTEQSTKIDIWSAGVILLTILSRRFPFFNSADDVEAMIEIATIFGRHRMQHAALLHGCMLETTIPTVGKSGFRFEDIILWSTSRNDQQLSDDEKLAVKFLEQCMELDPSKRISAEEALEHEFLRMGLDPSVEGTSEAGDDDEMDILKA